VAYEILMPQLSDSMDEGKLISWRVKPKDVVRIGDVIAEVESDKAIMEVQCFKNGEIEALHIKEGESAPVGTVIASIKLSNISGTELNEKADEPAKEKTIQEKELNIHAQRQAQALDRSMASPKAKVLAMSHGLNIRSLQKVQRLPSPSHEKDIVYYLEKRFFTPRSLNLIKKYKLDIFDFELSKKYDSKDVDEYVNKSKLSTFKPIGSFQKALMKNLEKSFQKPVFHIYDHIDSSYFQLYKDYSISAWLIKVFSMAMMEFEGFRSSIKDDGILLYSNASISFAMLGGRKLYMPVIKDANMLSIKEIKHALKNIQEDINQGSLKSSQMQDSTFGISNLGTTGIEGFDALINQDDSAIAAIGTQIDKKISVNLTIDHRLIDGYEAALFMQRLKALCLDEEFFKRNIEDV